MALRTPAPARDVVRLFPTPDVRDKLVYIEKDSKLPANQSFVYGQAHPDPIKYPGYKMVLYSPETEERWARWWFTNERQDQDAYNYEIDGEDRVIRTYLFPREAYPDDYDTLPFASDDPAFGSRYQFTHEIIGRAPQEYDGYFVEVKRIYQELIKERHYYDDDLDRDVVETRQIIEKGSNTESSTPGRTVEIDPQNTFYDIRTTSHLIPGPGDTSVDGNIVFPATLDTLPLDVNYRFPDLLQAVSVVSAYAYAYSSGAAPAYEEDYYFDVVIKEPAPGPHEARMLRFLTDDPSSIRAEYPLLQIVSQPETIPLVAAWYYASNDGNTAFALAKQVHIPPTVHDRIKINGIDTLAIVQQKTELPATPGFTNFANLGVVNIGIESRKTRYGLYEVQIIQVNASGIYNGNRGPFDSGGNTGAGDPYINPTEPPSVYSAGISSDNTVVSGTATISSSVSVIYNGISYGSAMSDTMGNFSIPLRTVFRDAINLQVQARRAGVLSGPVVVTTNDLSPLAPQAAINSALDTISGTAQAGSTVTLRPLDPKKQKITVTVSGVITVAGTVEVVVVSNLLPGGVFAVFVPVLTTDSAAMIANKIKEVLSEATSPINQHFLTTTASDVLTLEARVAAPNDNGLALELDNNTSAGLTPASGTVTQTGLGTVTLTADATSGVFSYTYNPPLAPATDIEVTASDAGGVSPPVIVTASADAPEIQTADFSGYQDIYGIVQINGVNPSAGEAEVVIRRNGVVVDTVPVSDFDGSFSTTLSENYVRGEVFNLTARLVAAPTVVSPTVTVAAPNLNLPAPSYTYSASLGGYTGVAPAPASLPAGVVLPRGLPGSLIVQYEPNAPAEVRFEIFAANSEFVFTLDEGGQNGQRYAVYYRYEDSMGNFLAYSDKTYISSPIVPLPGASVFIAVPAEFYAQPNWIESGWPGARYTGTGTPPTGSFISANVAQYSTVAGYGQLSTYPYNKMVAIVPPTREPGTTITIKFPGQDIPDIGPEAPAEVYYMGDVPSFPFEYKAFAQTYPPYWGKPPSAQVPRAGWYQNAAYPTRAAVRNAIPKAIRVITQAPDGRISQTIYDRDTSYPYTDPTYGSGI